MPVEKIKNPYKGSGQITRERWISSRPSEN